MLKYFNLAGKTARTMALALLLAVSLSVSAPRQAQAVCQCDMSITAHTSSMLGQWATEFEQWATHLEFIAQIIQIITFIQNTLSDFLTLFTDKLDTLIAVTHVDSLLEAKLGFEMFKETKSTIAESELAHVEAKTAAEHAMPSNPESQKAACRNHYARAGAFMDFRSRVFMMTQGINNALRGEGVDGTSPAVAGAWFKVSCAIGMPAGYPKTKSKIDGADAVGCVETDPEKAKKFANARIDYSKLKNAVMEIPDKGAKDPDDPNAYYPEPKNDAQRFWVAAQDFCFIAAGPRPTPPAGKGMTTPDGIVISAKWDHCEALRSSFVEQCGIQMTKNTRVNCNGKENEAECKFHEKVCKAAQAAGVDIKAVLRDPNFTSCDDKTVFRGFTPNQAEYLARLACLTKQRAVDGSNSGGSMADLLAMNDMCDLAMTTWRSQLAAEETAFVNAMMALHELKDCWPAVGIRPIVK